MLFILGHFEIPCGVFVGDFKGSGKSDIIVQTTNATGTDKYPFQYYEYTVENGTETINRFEAVRTEGGQVVEQWSFPIFKYTTGDFNNDGRTEIWAADEHESGCFYQIVCPDNTSYSHWPFQSYSTSSMTPFVGDFNGDGVSDLLMHNGTHWYVRICATPDSYGYYTYNVTDELVSAVAYESPYFGYDMQDRAAHMTFYLDIADMNGDGKSDIVVVNNTGDVKILYAPVLFGVRNGNEVNGHFAYQETFNASQTGLHSFTYSHCTGNFFGQESQGIMESIVFSMPPISDYYNVTSITDGMGNKTEFEYGYLTENPHEGADNIYTLSRDAEDREKDIFAISLPIKAAKKTTSYNVADPLGVKAINEYTYSGALLHRKGKGLLGLSGCTVESYVDGTPFHNYVERQFSAEMMGDHCALTPTTEKTFLKKIENGHLKRITEMAFTYDKHIHTNI